MQRLRLYDLRISRLPELIGVCRNDTATIARFVNDAQRRLITCKEVGDEGWYGTFAEIAFTASQAAPYVTMPRGIARLEHLAVCDEPIAVLNQFFEYLDFGNGRLPKQCISATCGTTVTIAYSRNNVPTFLDLSSPPKLLHIFATDAADMDGTHRVLIQGDDSNGLTLLSQDGLVRVTGQYVTLASPFVAFPSQLNSITGIQKDVTNGQVQFFMVDPVTGESTLILTMEPSETTASYRRYYLGDLPTTCCGTSASTLTLTAIAKLDLVPVVVDTDYCLLQNSEAIIEECQAIHYSMVDTPNAKMMADKHHKEAIRFLIGELGHYLGVDSPSVNFKPFGSADLKKINISMR